MKTHVTSTGKSSFSGLLSDFSKSVNRLLQNNIYDERKQSVIDIVMGRDPIASPPLVWYDPLSKKLEPIINRALEKISKRRTISALSTTYNVHGKSGAYQGEDLEDWLRLPHHRCPELVIIAFQEIVDLNVGQVLASSNANRLVWEQVVMESLNQQLNKRGEDSEYVMVFSDQLVGVSLILVAHSSILPRLRGIGSVKHKTGLWGMAGNKGAIAASVNIDDTSFCFLSAHFASGTTNVAERDDDFRNIYRNIRFLRYKGIDSHHYTVWLE